MIKVKVWWQEILNSLWVHLCYLFFFFLVMQSCILVNLVSFLFFVFLLNARWCGWAIAAVIWGSGWRGLPFSSGECCSGAAHHNLISVVHGVPALLPQFTLAPSVYPFEHESKVLGYLLALVIPSSPWTLLFSFSHCEAPDSFVAQAPSHIYSFWNSRSPWGEKLQVLGSHTSFSYSASAKGKLSRSW